jgi:hypothetical protein
MRRRLWRAPLAVLVAAVTVVGTSRAQELVPAPVPEPGPLVPGPVAPGPLAPAAASPMRPDGKWFAYGPVEVQEATPPRRAPVCDFFHKFNIGCYSTIHSAGCGNLNTEINYIFGSCHDWYGEPCKSAPPHGIGQAAYGPQPGYGSSGTAGCNCGP